MNTNGTGTANNALSLTNTADTNSGLNSLSNRFALDVQGFDAMRAQANAAPQQGLKAAAKQFDAVFTQMMLKSMREATPSDSPFDSHDSATFTSMLDQQLAQNVGAKGIGVADMMLKQLMRNAGATTSADGAGASGDSSANAGNMAAMNAMAKAYANAAGSSASSKASLSGSGYSADSALTPPARGVGSDKVASFVDRLAAPAQAASSATGIPARFIIGQAALESGWGKREIKNSDGSSTHNVFGIKATSDWTGKTVSAVTTEYVHGKAQKVVEKFRSYDSYEDALTDYASVLKSNPRYAPVVEASRDAAGFAHGMQKAGYATDPQYAKKLISIMRHIA
ncbi:flagellar assembly peptidoglycan hydrolase FlgJ [Caballeronia sp. SEWSISQ10-4 2]|uniref:flagellar assembly peptidoglycan hydrolase FlgJ n=1 Tax=Caballeronia sp. SEWSISQ10-4 2 TaxID=2937438 RepID=UPI00264EFC81|nr:flagellar assembly peptidoglycan hydrolase FlgJ [Caballeronia sp. SEWSISQ10-4 2]MDN7182038.1 flagellar assembly peptidoglycan hydrolase FlgJ [Caballeronia sp. SEWSISQ10-4 2]